MSPNITYCSIVIIVALVFSPSFIFSEENTERITCQSKIIFANNTENFKLQCSVELFYTSGGTAQCLNFTTQSLIVESSPSVINSSFKCLSNKPIFIDFEFEYGVPVKSFLDINWRRLTRDYNNPSSYLYEIAVIQPSNAVSGIGITSVKYNFFHVNHPDNKIQVLWHFSEINDDGNPARKPTLSWLGDITSNIREDNSSHTVLYANEEMVKIPCIAPNWNNLILYCFPDRTQHCPSNGIDIDNTTLYYDPLAGFLLNVTSHTPQDFYQCFDRTAKKTAVQNFFLRGHTTHSASSLISNFGTANEMISPPFVHTPYLSDISSTIYTRYNKTRFDLECRSTLSNITIYGFDPNREPLKLEVTYSTLKRPVKTFIAKCTTPAMTLEGQANYYCSEYNGASPDYQWTINTGINYTGWRHLDLAYDATSQTLKCFTTGRNNDGRFFPVEMRHVECKNIAMCRSLAKCLHDMDYGLNYINCRKDVSFGTICGAPGNESSSGVVDTCVSVKPFSKGLVFCTAIFAQTFQDIYFRGFDDKLYLSDDDPPVEAIMKITKEIEETDSLWIIPSSHEIQCEAHSFYFEEGLRWFFIHDDGSSKIIPQENQVEAASYIENDGNPTSKALLHLNDTSIVGIICSAPTLSIRDETSHITWRNLTISIQGKAAIPPKILCNDDYMKEINIGDEDEVLKCAVEAFPQPNIQWYRNGKLLNNTIEFVVKQSSGEYYLENFLLFPVYGRSDAGEYICIATYNAISVECAFTVRTSNNNEDDEKGQPSDSAGSFLLNILPIAVILGVSVVVVALSVALFGCYRLKTQKGRKEEMRQVFEILKGRKGKSFSDTNHRNSESVNPMNLPFDEKYELKKFTFYVDYTNVIGTGEFGTIYKGKLSNLPYDVAFKTINSKNDVIQLKALTAELKILMYIGKHENIVQLLGAYTQEIGKGTLYVAIELCGMGAMHSYLKTNKKRFLSSLILNPKNTGQQNSTSGYISESEGKLSKTHSLKTLLVWAAEIANGMEYLGSKNVVHSDLATRNVLLTNDLVAKITDFGLSRKMYTRSYYVKKGCDDPLPWRWLAIESLEKFTFSAESDVWSYGITLWEMFSFGDVPYPGINNPEELRSQIIGNQLRNPKPKFASLHLYAVMLKCWDLVPENRPSFRELKHLFRNAILNENYEMDNKADNGIGNKNQHYIDIEEMEQLEQVSIPKETFRFSAKDEIDLLKEVACIEPYRALHGLVEDAWTTVAVNCGKKYTSKSARRKFEDLVSKFKHEDFENLRRSGTDEEFDEISQLLTYLVERLHEAEKWKKEKKTGEKESKVIGENRKEKDNELNKRMKKEDRILQLIEDRQKTEIAVREKQLSHKEKKLALEERRLKLEEEKWRAETAEKNLLLEC